jgi:4-hydroxybenzoate polyprenyltransferase
VKNSARLVSWDIPQAFRVHHWTKNFLLFLPIILSHEWDDRRLIAESIWAFVCLLVVTSATYLINDISDINSDRQHWSKRHRPIASGRMPVGAALALALVLLAAGFAGALLLSLPFTLTLLCYLVLTLAYSFGLKRIALLDTLVISILFTLRLVMGVVLLDVQKPAWLLTFSVFFFFSLAMAKRHTEVLRAAQMTPKGLEGRGYEPGDAPLTLALGTGTAIASLVVLFIFIVLEMLPTNIYSQPALLSGIPVMLAIWLGRIWLLAHRGRMDDDPVSFALRDWPSLVLGILVAAFFITAL